MLGRLTLETSHNGSSGVVGVGDNNGVVICSSSHNHLQSYGECNISSPHSRSWSSVHSTPTSLSWHSVPVVLLSGGEEWCGSHASREGSGASGHLGKRTEWCVGGGQ